MRQLFIRQGAGGIKKALTVIAAVFSTCVAASGVFSATTAEDMIKCEAKETGWRLCADQRGERVKNERIEISAVVGNGSVFFVNDPEDGDFTDAEGYVTRVIILGSAGEAEVNCVAVPDGETCGGDGPTAADAGYSCASFKIQIVQKEP